MIAIHEATMCECLHRCTSELNQRCTMSIIMFRHLILIVVDRYNSNNAIATAG